MILSYTAAAAVSLAFIFIHSQSQSQSASFEKVHLISSTNILLVPPIMNTSGNVWGLLLNRNQ
jgi:hypothetical protein